MTVRELAARIEPGSGIQQQSTPDVRQGNGAGQSTFAEELRRAREHAPQDPSGLKLSAHAQQRIEQRGISLTEDQQYSLSEALGRLESKGSRDALLLRSDAAFIVNVPSRTVVTAVETSELKERVFTSIDSAMTV